MMGKLLKHEFKSTYKTFLCMYGALVVIFITAFLGKGLRIKYMSELAVFAMSCAVIPVIMIYFVTILKRYQNNIYGAEGYLTNTLPVKTWEILLTKAISAIAWGILTVIVGLIFGIAMIWTLQLIAIEWSDIVRGLSELFAMIGTKEMLFTGATIFVSCIVMVMQMYLSVSVANLPIITKANGLVSLIVFFVLSRLEGTIMTLVMGSGKDNFYDYNFNIDAGIQFFGDMVNEYAVRSILVGIGFVVVYFLVTHYILDKKLSIK